jgi:hypothetical protein
MSSAVNNMLSAENTTLAVENLVLLADYTLLSDSMLNLTAKKS